jgi:Ankyrin repeats (3 copies)
MKNDQIFWSVVLAQCIGAGILNTYYSNQSGRFFESARYQAPVEMPAVLGAPVARQADVQVDQVQAQERAWKRMGVTPLMRAAGDGQQEEIVRLLTNGADVNSVNVDGSDALMYAASAGHLQAVRSLLAAGANTRQVNRVGDTAKSSAKQQGFTEIVEMISAAN